MQPFIAQSCVPRIATGAIAPRALCPEGFMTTSGTSQEVQTIFRPTSAVRIGPRPFACTNFVSVTETTRASVQTTSVRGLGGIGATTGVVGAAP